MPFERYLQAPSSSSQHRRSYDNYPVAHPDPSFGIDASTFSSNVQFQVPRMMNPAPTLAPGGGAEVLPPGLLPSSGPISSWFPAAGYRSPDDFSPSCSASPVYRSHPSLTAPAYSLPPGPHSYRHPDFADSPVNSPPLSIPSSSSAPYAFPLQHPPPADILISPNSHIHLDAQLLLRAHLSIPSSSLPLSIPSAMGLPVYSASGFDFLSILSRVANRPHPKVLLGPVDLTCSFVVVDVRRYDSPIVYASPTFFKLTGYDEHEVLGRNCRFLQSPDGRLQRGEQRLHTAPEAVGLLKRCLVADKECQTSITNYKKGGAAFINLVTVIPIPGGVNNAPAEADDVAYHVGFQIDLTEQPNAILEKLRDGSYVVDYSRKPHAPPLLGNPSGSRNWRSNSISMSGVSTELRTLLADPAFLQSISVTTSTTASCPPSGEKLDVYDGNKPLHMFLLECAPDFIHVVSLKGAFLYVAPAVRSVLGYAPDDLVGRAVSDFCHPADVVPLMRELKESSITPGPGSSHLIAASSDAGPRNVDLLFRMRAQSGHFVWVECRGRLHVEPGKGRKAIILSGRLRSMPRLDWDPVDRAGGLAASARSPGDDSRKEREREFWALLSTNGTCLFVGAAVHDVLGWGAGEVIGRALGDFIGGATTADVRRALDDELARALSPALPRPEVRQRGVSCEMMRKDGVQVVVHITLFRSQDNSDVLAPDGAWQGAVAVPYAPPCPVVCQVKLFDAPSDGPLAAAAGGILHPLTDSVFDELHIARGSSWQYELQQLKFANQRIKEEVAALEASLCSQTRQRPFSQSTSRVNPAHEQQQQQSQQQQQREQYAHHPELLPDNTNNWSTPYVQYPVNLAPLQPSQTLKRSWHAIDGAPT
ncbi:hypothetical protein BKA93DRAFT_902463 [Sparassis latifolia]